MVFMWTTFLPESFYFWFPFLFIFLLLLLPLEIRISFDNLRKDKGISLQLVVLFWGKVKLWQLQRTFPAGLKMTSFWQQAYALAEGKADWYKSGKVKLQKITFLVYRFMRAIIWKKFDLKVKLGTGDPAWTALFTGFLRYLSGRGSPHVLRLLSFRKGSRPRFLVYPSFLEREFLFLLSVEFTASGLKILYYTVKIFWETVLGYQILILRRRSKNGRTSNPGFNDHSYGEPQGNG